MRLDKAKNNFLELVLFKVKDFAHHMKYVRAARHHREGINSHNCRIWTETDVSTDSYQSVKSHNMV